MRARRLSREKRGRDLPEMRSPAGTIDWLLPIGQASKNAGDVGLNNGFGKIKGKTGNRSGGVAPDSGKLRDIGQVPGQRAGKVFSHIFGRRLEVTCTSVITEALPGMEDVSFAAASERFESRKPFEPALVIWKHARDLSLLEHDFRNHDRIRVAGLPPRKIATRLSVPAQQLPAKPRFLRGQVEKWHRARHQCETMPPVGDPQNRGNWGKISRNFGDDGFVSLPMSTPGLTTYSVILTEAQVAELRRLLEETGFTFSSKPYTIFFAQKNRLSAAVYEKGPKLLLQGKGIEDFVSFELEPKILQEARLGYDEVHRPEAFEPHFGIDESGKGDFFGPLVIAGAYTDRELARKFLENGIQDSKRIGSDARIRALGKMIRQATGGAFDVVLIGPERYNVLYQKFGNLNTLLGWGHARVIENLLAKKPGCPRALSDKFADARVIEKALFQHGRQIQLEQRTRAESDFAVAAASILAREAFIDWLERTGKRIGLKLGRGVSGSVKETARAIVEREGAEGLRRYAKVHFRTAHEVAPDAFAEPPPKREWRR